ncbi:MAG: hypothetical protein LBG60_14500 [Bifidobacteriaceae bacterium]|jgi:hypothetical protein|nr:hypothetical protein [Bifidobacteriaceae bacterium]
MNKITAPKAAATALGVLLLLLGGSAAATADEALVDEASVDIKILAAERYPSGILALSVAANETTLAEQDSADPLIREFTGTLPTVTVTDNRPDVPDVPWAVYGTASDFVKGVDTISADHLGWTPALADDYGPFVEPGEDIEGVVDDPASEGLADPDGRLLYVDWDQLETYDTGVWSATAGLQLKVPAAELVPGAYTSVLTLSLFE